MLTSVRSLVAASLLAGSLLAAAPALAQDAPAASSALGGFSVTGNVALVTDYRFRGVSLSGGDPAIQGGVTLSHSSGFYVGTWSSSIDGGPVYGQQELDLFGGWTGKVTPALNVDVGLLRYVYPSGKVGHADYWEPYASVSGALGPVNAKVGVAYAWDQQSLADDHNLYVYSNLDVGIPTTPLTLSGHLGYTDGILSPSILAGGGDRNGWDWSLGASATILGHLTAGVSYVGVDGPPVDGLTNDTVVGSLTLSF